MYFVEERPLDSTQLGQDLATEINPMFTFPKVKIGEANFYMPSLGSRLIYSVLLFLSNSFLVHTYLTVQ